MPIPNIPIADVEAPTSTDLTDTENVYPLRDEITTQDSVGPESANRQPKALDLRTETLRTTVNLLVESVNALHANLLHRDGIDSVDNTDPPDGPLPTPSFMRADLSMTDPAGNGGLGQAYRVTGVADGVADTDAATMGQLNAALADLLALQTALGDYVRRDGTVAMTGNLNLSGRRVVNSADPQNDNDAVTKGYADPIFDSLQTGYIRRDGSIPMQAPLDMGNNWIENLPTTAPPDQDMAVSRRHVLDVLSTLAPAPVACIMPFAGSVVPSGWVLCDGRELDRTAFTTLYGAIGTTYGVGDGSTTFNVPDYRGRVPVCLDNLGTAAGGAGRITASWADQLGGAGGAETHSLTASEMPAHTHTYSDAYAAVGTTGSFTRATAVASDGDTFLDTPRSTGSAGSGAGHNNVQPSMAMNFIMKT